LGPRSARVLGHAAGGCRQRFSGATKLELGMSFWRADARAFGLFIGVRCVCTCGSMGSVIMAWQLQGTYIENCNCDVVCPCGASGFAAPADYDRCNAVLAWHIDSGQVEDTDVTGLSVVLLLDAPKQMSEGDWRVGMFMDDRASAEQSKKLGSIFSGAMGGPMANLTPLISENLGMEVAPIEHVDDGRRHRVKVGSAVEVDIEDVVSPFDPDGPPPKITESKHPANSDLTPARTLTARIRGLGIEYSADGQSGFSTPFSWSS
jgi:hypothetical protein